MSAAMMRELENEPARRLTSRCEQLVMLPMKIQRPSWVSNGERFSCWEKMPCQDHVEDRQQLEHYYNESSLQSVVDLPSIEACPEDLPTSRETNSTGTGGFPFGSDSEASSAMAYTTVMVLNIPRQISMKTFKNELNNSSWNGAYNFCNIPRCLATGRNLGFAFVNFNTAAQAEAFSKQWTGLEIFSKGGKLKIKPAKIQGIEANLQLAQKSMKRQNTSFMPSLTL